MARTGKNNTRDVDIVARYGGEEFVVVMPETDTPGKGQEVNSQAQMND